MSEMSGYWLVGRQGMEALEALEQALNSMDSHYFRQGKSIYGIHH